ncbi:MAG: tetratricopeptide repeat protein [Verrucomicrobia bacterium]|nr:tetratricopeptide repeat protein [Verrucomicrobiota bacterium]
MLTQTVQPPLVDQVVESVVGVVPTALRGALQALESASAGAAVEADADAVRQFEAARGEVVRALRAWARPDKKHPLWAKVRAVVVQVVSQGWLELAPSVEVSAAVSLKSWGELGALLLSTPSWRLATVAPLADVPDEWWGAYASWLLATPRAFAQPGEADALARLHERGVVELARWVDRNPGSSAVKAAVEAYLTVADPAVLALSSLNIRTAVEARARILTRCFGGKPGDFTPFPLPRAGRRLRVGLVAEDFGPHGATYRVLPLFEHLDPERFEVVLFVATEGDSKVEKHMRSRAKRSELLAYAQSDRLAQLRAAELDVAVFAGALDLRTEGAGRLALHRVAALQVCTELAGATTGLPEMDLFISGELGEPEGATALYRERLALLAGPAQVFNFEADQAAATQEWDKASLGIPDSAVVFTSAADYRRITPETWQAWVQLLLRAPEARLVLQPFTQGMPSEAVTTRFALRCEAELTARGIDSERVLISTLPLDNRADVRRLLQVGEVYLDSLPCSDPEGVAHALAAGLPVVATEGAALRTRAGASLARAAGLAALVATDANAYVEIAAGLAGDAYRRQELASALAVTMEKMPLFLDTLARSDAFASVLDNAFDEVVERGLPAFKSGNAPLRPDALLALDGPARHRLGVELLDAGRNARAVDYLMAALAHDNGTAVLWYDVARALRANGQNKDAIQALESALRLDEGMRDGWRMLAELADAVGMTELADDARAMIAQLTAASAAAAPKGLRLNLGGKLGQVRTTAGN